MCHFARCHRALRRFGFVAASPHALLHHHPRVQHHCTLSWGLVIHFALWSIYFFTHCLFFYSYCFITAVKLSHLGIAPPLHSLAVFSARRPFEEGAAAHHAPAPSCHPESDRRWRHVTLPKTHSRPTWTTHRGGVIQSVTEPDSESNNAHRFLSYRIRFRLRFSFRLIFYLSSPPSLLAKSVLPQLILLFKHQFALFSNIVFHDSLVSHLPLSQRVSFRIRCLPIGTSDCIIH